MNYSIAQGKIKFGPLYNFNNEKIHIWELYIELYDNDKNVIDITDADMDIPDGWYSELYTYRGYRNMKITKSAVTTILAGKNLGKKNATNVLTQAISNGNSKYKTKIRAGYSDTIDTADTTETNINDFPYPMALSSYKDQNHQKKLKYPLYVQPKLDGVRLLAKLNDKNQVILSSRRHKEILGFENLKSELQKILVSDQFVIDGELYLHGMDLQTISGIVRQEGDLINKDKLKLYVFDAFILNDNSGFEQRYQFLQKIFSKLNFKYIVLTETKKIDSSEEGDEYFEEKVSEGYEGIVYKPVDRAYEYSLNSEKRSLYNLKRKKAFDAEYKIVDFTEGKGKDIGCVIFICETEEGVKFNSVPNGTYDYRKELYQDCLQNFNSKYKDKYAKVYYEALSKKNVPLRNRMIQVVRDTTFD